MQEKILRTFFAIEILENGKKSIKEIIKNLQNDNQLKQIKRAFNKLSLRGVKRRGNPRVKPEDKSHRDRTYHFKAYR